MVREARMKRRSGKQFAVLGLGRFGTSLAVSLCKRGHEVLAVDQDQSLVDEIAPFVTQAVCANAAEEGVLAALGVRNCDAAVVAIGQDVRSSILVTVLCKELGIGTVVAKATDALHAAVLQKVGADRVVFPERDMGQRVALSLERKNFIDVIDLNAEYRLMELTAPEKWCGRTLKLLDVRRRWGVNVIAIQRSGRFIVSPGADETICRDDALLVLGKSSDMDMIDER